MTIEVLEMIVLGIMNDVLVTLYYIFVGRLQGIPASVMTVLITLLNFFVIKQIVVSINWTLILFYALGCAIGCFSIIFLQKKKLAKQKAKRKSKKN